MNKTLLFVVFLICKYTYSQNIIFEDIPKNLTNLIELSKNDSIPTVYIADIISIKKIVQNSKKKYKIIYFFSPTCHSCKETFPSIREYTKINDEYFDLFVISGHRYDNINKISDYLNTNSFYEPIFIINTKLHGNSKNPFKRLDLLSQELCNTCEHNKMGFSAYFVLDIENKVVFHTNWEINNKDKINKLKELQL